MAGNDRPNTKTFRLPVNSGITPDGFSENVPLMLTNNYVLLPDGSGIKPREGFEIRRNDAVGYGSSRKLIYFISNPPDIDYGDMLVIVNTKDGRNFNETTEVVRTTNTVASENPMPMPALPTPTPVTYAAVATCSTPLSTGITFYNTASDSYHSHVLDVVVLHKYVFRLSNDIIAVWDNDNASLNQVYLFKISDIQATGPAFAGGFTTWADVPKTAFWKKLTFPNEIKDANIVPISNNLALFVIDNTVHPINLIDGTVGASYVITAPIEDDNGLIDQSLLYPDGWRYTTDGRVATILKYYVTSSAKFGLFVGLLNPTTRVVTWKLLGEQGSTFYDIEEWDITSGNVLVGMGTKNLIARYDITTYSPLADISTGAAGFNSIEHVMSYGGDVFGLQNGKSSIRYSADGSLKSTYLFGVAAENFLPRTVQAIYNGKVWVFGITKTTNKGRIIAYNLSDNLESVNAAFVEANGAHTNSYFTQTAWADGRVPDPFLLKRLEMTGA